MSDESTKLFENIVQAAQDRASSLTRFLTFDKLVGQILEQNALPYAGNPATTAVFYNGENAEGVSNYLNAREAALKNLDLYTVDDTAISAILDAADNAYHEGALTHPEYHSVTTIGVAKFTFQSGGRPVEAFVGGNPRYGWWQSTELPLLMSMKSPINNVSSSAIFAAYNAAADHETGIDAVGELVSAAQIPGNSADDRFGGGSLEFVSADPSPSLPGFNPVSPNDLPVLPGFTPVGPADNVPVPGFDVSTQTFPVPGLTAAPAPEQNPGFTPAPPNLVGPQASPSQQPPEISDLPLGSGDWIFGLLLPVVYLTGPALAYFGTLMSTAPAATPAFASDGNPNNATGNTGSSPAPAQDAPTPSSDPWTNGAQPIGYINPVAFQTATFDPSANNNASYYYAYGTSYATQAQANAVQAATQDYDPDDDDDDDPVVLDLAGPLHLPDGGIKITQLSSSNTFFDVTGSSGKQELTAWAAAGNGVLFFDPTGQGQLTQAKQINFMAWDPGATSDMQALSDVFDTNHDGSLDSSDTNFSDFYVMVTNANGTQTAYSLAQLGITSINLTANTTNIVLPDGSSINGETTYTTSSGATGTAATVTFAVDPDGMVIATTTTTNADGSTTIKNVALNDDGSVAYSRILNTSANGLTKTIADLNSGGVVTSLQTDVTTLGNDGSTSETVTNYWGGTIQANGELTGSGTTGSEKLNATTTQTSANGKIVTILRDQLGGGWTSEQEVDTTNSDGSTSIVVSDLNPNGTASEVTTTAVSADRLTRTVTDAVDGNASESTKSIDQININGGTETETVTDSTGTTVTSLVTTVTQTTANAVTRTTSSDLTDGLALDYTSVAQTVTSSSGSSITQTDKSSNGTLLDESVTNNAPQSGGGLVTTVASSVLDGYGRFINVGSETTTISNAGATETTTTVDDSSNGTLRYESVITSTVGSAAKTVTVYGNGDGDVTHSEVVTINGGITTDTVEDLNGNGSLVDEIVTATSNGGLSKTTSIDSIGAGTASAPIFDHITTDVTTTSGGVSTEIITDYGAATTAGDEIDRTRKDTSANGLTTTVYEAYSSAALSGGYWDRISTDQTTVNSNGSVSETMTLSDGNTHVLQTTQKTTSADRRTVTSVTTWGPTGYGDKIETMALQSDGSTKDTVFDYDGDGDVTSAVVTTTSADGLTKTVQTDIQGQSAAAYAASGFVFDTTTTDATLISTNGSRTETINVAAQNGAVVSTETIVTSANGLSTTTTVSPFNSAPYASSTTDATVINTDGSQTETVSTFAYNGGLTSRTTTTTSASGLSMIVIHDLNGDGVTDQSTTDMATINADGSRTEVVTDYIGGPNGALRDYTSTTSGIIVQGKGLETTIARFSNGSVPSYQVETIAPNADGSTTDTTEYFAHPGGTLLEVTTVTTSANGLSKTTATELGGDSSNDFWTIDVTGIDSNGTREETVATYNKAGLISETLTATSANGLDKTTYVDANGAMNGSQPIFNEKIDDGIALNSDGTRTETVTARAANGVVISQSVAVTSASQQASTTYRYLGQTGSIGNLDQEETKQTRLDGAVVDTITSYDATGAVLSNVTTTTSSNGLSKSKTFEDASGTTYDAENDTETYDTNGDGGTLLDLEDSDVVSGTTLRSSVKTSTTANGQSGATIMALTGAVVAMAGPQAIALPASFTATASSGVGINSDGSVAETVVDTINGSVNDTTTTVTAANQLSKITYTSLSGASPYIVQRITDGLDGSKSEVTTYYNPSAPLTVIEEQTTVNTSADGRTIVTTTLSDDDFTNQAIPFNGYTPNFGGTGFNIQTSTFVENADGTTTTTVSGSGAFGAPAYSQTTNVVTNADSSIAATRVDYDATHTLIDQIVSEISPDGLVKSYAYDTTGQESLTTLTAAAADLATGAALPSLLSTDIIETDTTTLNGDGSKTEIVESGYGASFANLRSLMRTDTSSNGLVSTTFVAGRGIGIYEQIDTVTKQADGSTIETDNFYNDDSGTMTVDSQTVGSTLVSSSTTTISADGLTEVMTSSTGVTDTTAYFANSNGSYDFAQDVGQNSEAADQGDIYIMDASHFVDANGIDTWTWNQYNGTSGTISIDVATEKQDVAIANEIYQTLLGRSMSAGETQSLAQYISNGVLDREALAQKIALSPEYGNFIDLSGIWSYRGGDVLAALENALGRPPTAEEMAVFDQNNSAAQFSAVPSETIDAFIPEAVAIAQYATDMNDHANLTTVTANQQMIAPSGGWLDPANDVDISVGGTYGASGSLVVVRTFNGTYNYTDIIGNNNLIYAADGTVTVSGFGNAIDINSVSQFNYQYPNQAITVDTSNASILVEDANIGIVSGDNNQVAQVGPSELELTSGSGDEIYITSGAQATVDYVLDNNGGRPNAYLNSYSTTYASNASITLGYGVGSSGGGPALIYGNNDVITLTGDDQYVVTGTGDVLVVKGNDQSATINDSVIDVASGVSGVWINGNNDLVSLAAGSAVVVNGNNDTITANNAQISFASYASGETINGGSNLITVATSDSITITGTNDTINVDESEDTIVGNGTINVASGVTDLNVVGANSRVVGAPSNMTLLRRETNAYGSITLTQIGNDYFLDDTITGIGPELHYQGTPASTSLGPYTLVGAARLSNGGYEAAWYSSSLGQFSIWNTDSSGNYVSYAVYTPNSTGLESIENSFELDLNGDGVIGVPSTVSSITSSTASGTLKAGQTVSLTVNFNQSVTVNTTNGRPTLLLNDGGVATYVGGSGTTALVFTYTIASGQSTSDLATASANAISLNGSTIADPSGQLAILTGANNYNPAGTLEIGVSTTSIETAGATDLVQAGSNYFLENSGGAGPELQYNGAPVTTGEFVVSGVGTYTVVGVEQLSGGGYEVALKIPGADKYSVWTTDANGNYTGNLYQPGSGTASAFEALESSFHQDLNGDGVIGTPASPIESAGSTKLVISGANFYLDNISSGNGPELKYNGSAVTAGEFTTTLGTWTPIGVEQTSGGGYEVAFTIAGTDEFSVWSTDSTGNYTGTNLFLPGSGLSSSLESLETSFQQDLNGDGTIGVTSTSTIESAGSNTLVKIGNNYYLNNSSGIGPELQYDGTPVTVGEFVVSGVGTYAPIGVEQLSNGGYEVAWGIPGADAYSVWVTDANGNYNGTNLYLPGSGATSAFESLEQSFHQDLNGDGVLGLKVLSGTTVEVSGANSSPVTFASPTGKLKLDTPTTFTGQITGFTGNGTLAGSDQIDLTNMSYSSLVQSKSAYNSSTGALSVSNGTTTDVLQFSGSYSFANFKFADDGSGGTIVYDPPVAGVAAPSSQDLPSSVGAGSGDPTDTADGSMGGASLIHSGSLWPEDVYGPGAAGEGQGQSGSGQPTGAAAGLAASTFIGSAIDTQYGQLIQAMATNSDTGAASDIGGYCVGFAIVNPPAATMAASLH